MQYSNFHRFAASVSAIALLVTSVFTFSARTTTAATTFTDAGSIAAWAADSVAALVDSGVLTGRPDGSFDPQGTLNRAELAKIAQLSSGLTTDTTGAPHFNDVSAADWYYNFVETLYNNGVVGGINGGALDAGGMATYNPGGTVNRAEAAKILVDAFALETSYAGTPPNFPDVSSSAWYYDYVETAYAHGILNGYDNSNFGPGDAVTREQVAVVAQNSVVEEADGSKRRSTYTAGPASTNTPEVTETETEETETVVEASDGTLGVAISASSPDSQTFPQGASSTAVAAYDFTASSDDITLTSLVVKRTGVGTDSDWTLYIYDGADRLTSGKTVNSTSHSATLTGLNVRISKGTTKTLTLKADTAASAGGGDSYFEIVSADSVSSNAQSVTGSFPVKSNRNEVNTSVTAGSITIIDTGSITNPKVGEDGVTIAKFKLTTATEDGLVDQIALLVDGTITSTDIQNARLYQSGVEIASADTANSKDLLVFTFDTPYTIVKGDSRNFEVVADLNTGRNSDTIKIYLDENTDLTATGGTYGFGMTVTATGYDGGTCTGGGSDECSYSELQGGDITISSSGPTATDIAVNGDDVVLMAFNVTSVSEATFKKFGIILTTNDGTGTGEGGLINDSDTSNYTDIKIVNTATGAVLMGPIDATSLNTTTGGSTAITDGADDDGFYTFTDEFTMSAGESLDLELTVDIENNTDSDFTDDTISASLDLDNSSVLEIKDLNNKTITNTSSVVPTTDITGKTMSVASASLTVTKSSTPVSDTSVKGSTDVNLLGLTIAAGDASDIKITEMKVRVYANDDADFDTGGVATNSGGAGGLSGNDLVSNLELVVDGTTIAGPEGFTLTGTITGTGYYFATFDNISYTISAGETIQIIVQGDLSNNVSATRYVTADIDPDNDITAEDSDGNSVTASGTSSLNLATSPSPLLTVSTGGSLTVAVDASTAKEDIAVAGTAGVEISRFKFTTTDEAFLVTKLSINNRQSDADNIGDYDNNVSKITLSYTNSDGATETKSGFLTGGTASFSGMDLYIDKDDDAVLTVSADLNTISAGATAAEFVDFNIAFNNFEAVAQGSGETYTGAKIDSAVAATSDLDFGSITIIDAGDDVAGGAQAVTAGSSATITVPDIGTEELPIGTLVAFTATAGTYVEATDTLIALTTAYSGAASDLTMVGLVINAGAGDVNALDINYALPGTGYLTSANQMHIYESQPTLALSSSSPSGSRTTSASDSVFIFTVSADSQEKVQLRTAKELGTWVIGVDADGSVANNETTTTIDGTASNWSLLVDAGDSIYVDVGTTGLLDGTSDAYARLSFWLYSDDAAAQAVSASSFKISTHTTTAAVGDNISTLTAAITDNTWTFFDMDMPSNATDASDQYIHFELDAVNNLADADFIIIDQFKVYNEKIDVDFASDSSMATAGHTLVAYLKEGGSTVATGYINESSTSAATVQFVPVDGTDSAIEISKGTTKTFTLQVATTTLITDAGGTDDLLTLSIDLGTSTGGTVTAGDFWWQETNSTVKWTGQVSNTTLNGNTLKY